MLSPYPELFHYAKEHRFTVGGFNSFNMETMQGIIAAANEKDVPMIVQTYHADIEYAGREMLAAMCNAACHDSKVKVAMGLDHGQSFEQAVRCIESGFSGVMIDLSSEDYDRNVYETKRVVEYAHARGISVEAEIGKIFDATCPVEVIATGYTDPDVARRFAKDTNIDCLAVSIGTAHGIYKYEPKINFDLLKELVNTVSCPIVVHGGSGTPDEDVIQMVELGIAKLNVGTDLFIAYKNALYDVFMNEGPSVAPVTLMSAGREAVKQCAMHKIDLLTTFRT